MLESVNLNDAGQTGFLLIKHQSGRYLKSYKMGEIRTDYFKRKLESELSALYNKYIAGDVDITDIHEDADDGAILVLNVGDYQLVGNTIERIFRWSEADPINEKMNISRAKVSAILFERPNSESVIAIDNVEVTYKDAFEKGMFIATIDKEVVDELDTNSVLVFKYGLTCIYFEKYNRLLVLDRKRAEGIFNLLEHYQLVAQKKFTELIDGGIIEIDESLLRSELECVTIASKINSMVQKDAFKMDINYYKRYERMSSDFDDKRTKITIQNDRVIISDKDDLRSFLNITREDVVESMVEPDKKFLARNKSPIKRRQANAD